MRETPAPRWDYVQTLVSQGRTDLAYAEAVKAFPSTVFSDDQHSMFNTFCEHLPDSDQLNRTLNNICRIRMLARAAGQRELVQSLNTTHLVLIGLPADFPLPPEKYPQPSAQSAPSNT